QSIAVDAATVRVERERSSDAEDAVQLRRVSMGVFVAVDGRGGAGSGQSRRAPGERVTGGGDKGAGSNGDALCAVNAEGDAGGRKHRGVQELETGDKQRGGVGRRRGEEV